MELCVDRLTKLYQNKIAVDRFSTNFTGGVYGLLGENGSGKTTFMRMLADLLTPTSGEILLDGVSAYQLGERYREQIGYLPQIFGVYHHFTAMDFLLYLSAAKGIEKKQALLRSEEVLEWVGLRGEAKTKVRFFSGGMKQRLGIAQALLNDPAVLLLDEPTAGLDPKERIRFRTLISELSCDRIIILSTHIVSDVESIASEILMIKNGQLIRRGTPKELSQSARGKVWTLKTDQKEARFYKQKNMVANLRNLEEGAELRLISDQYPARGAVAATPTLEDAYLYYFQEGKKDEGADLF